MTHITDYGGAIDDYYPNKMERIVDITEHERAADIEAENARMSAEALDGDAIATIKEGPHSLKQGRLVKRHSDGTVTIEVNGNQCRGVEVKKEKGDEG